MIVAYRRVHRRIACRTARRGGNGPSPDRVPYGPSRREWPVAGSSAVRPVAAGMARRRIACCGVRCVRDSPSPDRVRERPSGASRAVGSVAGSRLVTCRRVRRRIACGMARRRIASRHVSAHPSDRTSLPCSWSGEPHARHRPCPGPTCACSRRRHRRYTNVYSCVVPWRSIEARSAARLSAIVGPLSRHGACRTGEPLTSL